MLNKFVLYALLMLCGIFSVNAQVKVIFKTGKLPAGKNAGGVFLAGGFNGWNPADKQWQLQPAADSTYTITQTLAAGNYELKATRGSWEKVECGATGQGVGNRQYKINRDTTIILNIEGWQDSFVTQPKRHTVSDNVYQLAEKFDMPQLGRQRRVWIYIPPDYAVGKKKYPVIYMHDGQNLFDEFTAGYGEWGVDEILDKMPNARQSIIVGIDHGGQERISEYNPYDSKYGKGRGNDYVDFLANTIKPYIDKNYRTLKDAKSTTIAGSSMGGLISMYAVLKYPDVFGTAGVFSPAFWLAPDIYTYATKQKLKSYSRFYFACGDAESETMVSDMQKMAGLLQAKGLTPPQILVTVLKGEKHNEKQWNTEFSAFYEWVMGWD